MSPTTLPVSAPRVRPRPPARRGPLLVATDARAGAGALRAAFQLAARSGGEVEVLAVLEPLPVYFGPLDSSRMTPDLEAERWDALRERVRRQVRGVLGPNVSWPVEVRRGDPAVVIADMARERDSELVVIGAGRHRLLDRLLAEQTALRVVRHADRPVLVVPEGFITMPGSIVVATDFTPTGAHAAEVALSLAGAGAAVHLVHAWDPAALTGPMSDALPAPAPLQRLVDEYAAELPARFERLLTVLTGRPDVTITTDVVQDRAAPAVLESARARGSGLVVAGRHARPFAERVFVGSVTSALVRAGECAVLVTPEPPPVEHERLERALTGASTGTDPDAWRAQVDGFSRRNAGRRAVLTVDDPSLGGRAPVTQVSGYALLGVAYDPHDARLEVMLGTTFPGQPHLTREIGGIDAVTVVADRDGWDLGLRVRHGRGETQIAFTSGPPPAAA